MNSEVVQGSDLAQFENQAYMNLEIVILANH